MMYPRNPHTGCKIKYATHLPVKTLLCYYNSIAIRFYQRQYITLQYLCTLYTSGGFMLDFNFLLYALVVIVIHMAVVALIIYKVFLILKLLLRLFEKYWFVVVCVIGLIISWLIGVFDSLATYLLY